MFLMKSHKWHDKYVIPGGHVELGERLAEAVQREVKEETGLEVHSIEFLDTQESIFDEEFHRRKHFVFFDYVCKASSSEVTLNSEGQEYIWTTIDEAMKLPLGKYTCSALQACESNLSIRQIVQKQPLNRKSLAQMFN